MGSATPLSTSGRFIIDANGRRVKLAGSTGSAATRTTGSHRDWSVCTGTPSPRRGWPGGPGPGGGADPLPVHSPGQSGWTAPVVSGPAYPPDTGWQPARSGGHPGARRQGRPTWTGIPSASGIGPKSGYREDPANSNHPEDPKGRLFAPDGSANLLFVRVPEGKQVKNRVHLDLAPGDSSPDAREWELRRILGPWRVPGRDHRCADGAGWVVLADPEGNEFCLERGVPGG